MTTLCRELFLAVLLGSAVLMPGFAVPVAAEPEVAGTCAPNAVKFKVADKTASTSSEDYVPVGGAKISFTQAGPGRSCVVVLFAADARSELLGTLVDVGIFLDGGLCRGGTFAATQSEFLTTTINAVCPDVRPGSRTIEVKFRASADGVVELTNYTTIVHHRQ